MYDKVTIRVKAGDGGDGVVSFRREAHVPLGGPDGGDGGDGGKVIIVADPSVTSLRLYNEDKLYNAERGDSGRGKKQHGKNGEDLILRVPLGTIVMDMSHPHEPALIADCELPDQPVVVAMGGKGGMGNVHYVSSTNQTPRIAQKGEAGAEIPLTLELRLIADVGIIGFPNAGKSTLLTAISAARPKIADYPFTTLEPELGVVEVGLKRFVVAEIPGLIEGAHLGKGLGHDFLRHIVRTKILIHLIDGSSASPLEDMVRVNTELTLYDAALAKKPQIVVINKVDLPGMQERLAEIKKDFKSGGINALFVSAALGEGTEAVTTEALKLLNKFAEAEAGKVIPKTIFRPQPRAASVNVYKEGDIFVVESAELERLSGRVGTSDPEVQRQLQRQLGRLGINRALEASGVKVGDKVRCGTYEWEY